MCLKLEMVSDKRDDWSRRPHPGITYIPTLGGREREREILCTICFHRTESSCSKADYFSEHFTYIQIAINSICHAVVSMIFTTACTFACNNVMLTRSMTQGTKSSQDINSIGQFCNMKTTRYVYNITELN